MAKCCCCCPCSRFTNIQLINTMGVAPEGLNACIVSMPHSTRCLTAGMIVTQPPCSSWMCVVCTMLTEWVLARPQQCPCAKNPDHGSFFCCKDCPATDGPAVDYHLEYVVTYR